MPCEEKNCMDRAKRSLSVVLCARSTPISAALYTASLTLPFRAEMSPPCEVFPVQKWEGEMKHKHSSLEPTLQQDSGAGLLPGDEGCACAGLREKLCQSSLLRRGERAAEGTAAPFGTAVSTAPDPQGQGQTFLG